MNKIAAYQVALENLEAEKRAEHLIDVYGTSEGYLPQPYLLAFDQLEKEANIVANFGKALKATGGNMMRAGGTGTQRVNGRLAYKFTGKGLKQFGQHYGGRALRAMGRNPGATLAVGGLGTAGAAGLGYKALS